MSLVPWWPPHVPRPPVTPPMSLVPWWPPHVPRPPVTPRCPSSPGPCCRWSLNTTSRLYSFVQTHSLCSAQYHHQAADTRARSVYVYWFSHWNGNLLNRLEKPSWTIRLNVFCVFGFRPEAAETFSLPPPPPPLLLSPSSSSSPLLLLLLLSSPPPPPPPLLLLSVGLMLLRWSCLSSRRAAPTPRGRSGSAFIRFDPLWCARAATDALRSSDGSLVQITRACRILLQVQSTTVERDAHVHTARVRCLQQKHSEDTSWKFSSLTFVFFFKSSVDFFWSVNVLVQFNIRVFLTEVRLLSLQLWLIVHNTSFKQTTWCEQLWTTPDSCL